QDTAEATSEAHGQRLVHLFGRTLVGGPIARAIDQTKHLAAVGQRQDQRVIAPGAVVGDVHTLLALPLGGRQGAVHIDDGLLEEGVGLRGPGLQARVVDKVQQRVDVGAVKASAEVAGRGGIGDAACPQRVEEVFVLASQFEVLQTSAVAQSVVGD